MITTEHVISDYDNKIKLIFFFNTLVDVYDFLFRILSDGIPSEVCPVLFWCPAKLLAGCHGDAFMSPFLVDLVFCISARLNLQRPSELTFVSMFMTDSASIFFYILAQYYRTNILNFSYNLIFECVQ
jgi:hypothetical protein